MSVMTLPGCLHRANPVIVPAYNNSPREPDKYLTNTATSIPKTPDINLTPTLTPPKNRLLVNAEPAILNKKWFNIFISQQACITLGLAAASAIIASCQSVMLGWAFLALSTTGNFHLAAVYVGLFFLTTLVARGLSYLCDLLLPRWNELVILRFVKHVNKMNAERIEIFANSTYLNNLLTINHQAEKNITDMTRIIKDSVSYGSGLLANMTVIATMIPTWLMPVLIIAVLLLASYILLRYKHRDSLAKQQQDTHQAVSENIKAEILRTLLGTKVDNPLGNTQVGWEGIGACRVEYTKASGTIHMWKGIDSLARDALVCILCGGTLTYATTLDLATAQNALPAAQTMAFFIGQLLQISNKVSEWLIACGNIDRMVKQVQPVDVREWNNQMDKLRKARTDDIEITYNNDPMKLIDLDENPIQQLLGQETGHCSITGKNGTLKSILLLATVKYLTEHTKQKLGYWSHRIAAQLQSTEGELTEKKILDNIQRLGDLSSGILILEDGDTHLHDPENRKILRDKIAEWSKTRLVIEVRNQQAVELEKTIKEMANMAIESANEQIKQVNIQRELVKQQTELTNKREELINKREELMDQQVESMIEEIKSIIKKTATAEPEQITESHKSMMTAIMNEIATYKQLHQYRNSLL